MRPPFLLTLFLALPRVTLAAALPSQDEAGKRLYRTGLSSGGAPVPAVLEGTGQVSGRQLPCASCHGQSGMGSVEGTTRVVPVAAPFLRVARAMATRPRPPYSEATLLRAIQEGVDSGGNHLGAMMPRYSLSAEDAHALVTYLERLSSTPSPGVRDGEVHFATVVTPGVSRRRREAMLRLIAAYFQQKTANALDQAARHTAAWPEFYGRWVLHVWELQGAPQTWRDQLEARAKAEPVFALVSGLGGATWAPVDAFCEDHELPCLLPNVDAPPENAEGRHTLYFSRGVALEAAVVAQRLGREPAAQRVLQVVGRRAEARLAATSLRRALQRQERDTIVSWTPSRGRQFPNQLAAKILQTQATAVVLWLDASELSELRDAGAISLPLFASSTLLGGDGTVAGPLHGWLVHPFALPPVSRDRFRATSSWLRARGLEVSPDLQRLQDQTFFALTVLGESFMHLQRNFLGDYLLEGVDHLSGFEAFSASYAHVSFAPGQRYLSRGAYLVPLGDAAPSAKPVEWWVP